MAQPGNFTPILLYSSSTSTNVPLAANLTNSTNGAELAINIADKNLFFKDSGGTVNTVPIRQSGTSSNGWLSYTDWNTFNSKAPATSGTSLLYGNGSGGFSNVTIGSGITFAGGTLSATGSGGTVTSVTGTSPVVSSGGATPAISLATAYGDTLNPYASKTANYILAAPNGSAGVPTFRALVAADLPSLSGTYIPYTGASSAIDLNAQTVTNIAHLGINSTAVPDILLRAYGDNNSTSRIAIRGYSSNASSSSIRVAKFRGTFASPQAPLSGDSLGKFELAGYGTTSSSGYPQASYEGVATENWGATARGAKTLFYVTPNTTTTQAVALTLDQDKSATFASTVTATSFSGSGSSLTGVVTSVTGTSPVVSSGGTTPAISMPAATTSVSGYLTSTDWNTFNSKQPAGTYVTSISIASSNGFTGTSSGGVTPSLTLATSVTGILKGNGTAISAATSGTDYAPATSGNSILYGNGAGGFSNVTVGTGLTFIGGTLASTASGGTVTSVAASVPAFLSISGSPITTSGTLAISYSGTALPVANGGTATTTAFTAGSVVFAGASGVYSQSNSTLFWDNTNKRLGVGGATPQAPLHVNAANNTTSLFLTPNSGGTAGDYTQLGFGNSAGSATVYGGIRTAFLSPAGTAAVSMQFFTHDGTSYAQRMQIGPNGGVSIGNTTDPGAGNLSVNSSIFLGTSTTVAGEVFSLKTSGTYGSLATNTSTASWYPYVFQTNSVTVGYIASTSIATVYSTTSDRRLKRNILPLTNSGVFIDSMLPRTYTWINGDIKSSGFIADELQTVCPTAVVGEPNQLDSNNKPIYQGIDASDPTIIANIVAELQSIRARLKAANIE